MGSVLCYARERGVLAIGPDLRTIRSPGHHHRLALPIIARPSPPFGAHSSFATRSSLFARIARHSVVTLTPWLFVSVCASQCGQRRHRTRAAAEVDEWRGRTWKR